MTDQGSILWPRRWYCLDCERFFVRPPHREGDDRYHSWRCKTPLRLVSVEIRRIDHP